MIADLQLASAINGWGAQSFRQHNSGGLDTQQQLHE